ncbi:MAG: tetratricopeptide repeat protein [Opitutales bacterium]|nr:tetratricopeptide repeat protein [Opitutales bacterium]
MKRILFTLTGTLCASLPMAAQTVTAPDSGKAGLPLTMEIQKEPMVSVSDMMKNPKWIEAFVYSFTPLSDVEPTLDAVTRDFYQTLQPVLSGENSNFALAYKMLKDEIASNGAKANASLFFTLGAVAQQLSVDASEQKNAAQAKSYLAEAVDNYNKAIDSFPNYQRARRNLGLIYMNSDDKGDIAKAIPHLEKAVALGARDASTYAMLGYCNFLQGNLYSAENALKTALTLDASNKDVYQLLAQVMLQQSRYKEARAMFNELIKKDMNNAQWWMALVNTYLAENDLDNCVVSLEVLRHMKKAETQSLYLLGNIYIMRGMHDMASEVYIQAIKEAPTQSLDDAIDAARSLASYGAFDQATKILDVIAKNYKGTVKDEQEMAMLTLRSNINISQGKGEEAAKVLTQILDRDPNNGDALNSLASYYAEMVEVQDGKEVKRQARDFEMAEMLLLRAEDLTNNQAKLRALTQHARLLVGKKDTDSLRKAVRLLERAQEIESSESVEQYIQVIRTAIASSSAR